MYCPGSGSEPAMVHHAGQPAERIHKCQALHQGTKNCHFDWYFVTCCLGANVQKKYYSFTLSFVDSSLLKMKKVHLTIITMTN